MMAEDLSSLSTPRGLRDGALTPGEVVADKYRVEGMVGESALGRVYRATDLALGRIVALKVLWGTHASGESAQTRLQREAVMAGRLEHPNAVALLDYGVTDDGLGYLITEFLVGRTLHAVLEAQEQIAPAEAARVAVQVLSALAAAHDAEVVHGNLRPQTVILTTRPNAAGDLVETVKVTDFELARPMGHAHASSDLGDSLIGADASGPWGVSSASDLLVSTPEYLSPEQWQGLPLDGRSDLYVVGVLLYQLLTGGLPFAAGTEVGVILQQLRDTAVAPSRLAPAVPEELDAIVLRALERTPDARFADAREMAKALGAYLAAQPARKGWALISTLNVEKLEAQAAAGRSSGVVRIADRDERKATSRIGPVTEQEIEAAVQVVRIDHGAPSDAMRGAKAVKMPGLESGVVAGDQRKRRPTRFNAPSPLFDPTNDAAPENYPSLPPREPSGAAISIAAVASQRPRQTTGSEEYRKSLLRVVGDGDAPGRAPAPKTKLGVGEVSKVPYTIPRGHSTLRVPTLAPPPPGGVLDANGNPLPAPKLLADNPEFLTEARPPVRLSSSRPRLALAAVVIALAGLAGGFALFSSKGTTGAPSASAAVRR